MDKNESVQFFLRFLLEKHERFKSELNNLLKVLVEENKDSKKKNAESCLIAAQTLRNNISNLDTPGWLNESIQSLDHYVVNFNSSGANHALLKILLRVYSQINSYQWQFNDEQKILAFDFDSIYEQCKKESRIDELFENIISLLQKIIDSGEIDSIRVQLMLERIIGTLKKHNSASYFSLHSMWDFLMHAMKNILWEQLEAIPAIGPTIKGLHKTLEETEIQLVDLHNHMRDKMKEKFSSDFYFLNKNPLNLLDDEKK